MRIENQQSDDAIVGELGRRLTAERIRAALTQDQLAERAGVGRSTVQRVEGGGSIQLASLVRLLRALDRLDALDALLPAEARSPLAELEQERRRAPRRRVRHGAPTHRAAWTWGEDGDA